MWRTFSKLRMHNFFQGFKKSRFKFNFVHPVSTNRLPRSVPSHIKRPDYTAHAISINKAKYARLLTDFTICRNANKLARETLDYALSLALPYTTTDEIDAKVHEFIIQKNAYPSPLHYHDFPKSICTSVNNVICHGIPDERKLLPGDIISVDH